MSLKRHQDIIADMLRKASPEVGNCVASLLEIPDTLFDDIALLEYVIAVLRLDAALQGMTNDK